MAVVRNRAWYEERSNKVEMANLRQIDMIENPAQKIRFYKDWLFMFYRNRDVDIWPEWFNRTIERRTFETLAVGQVWSYLDVVEMETAVPKYRIIELLVKRIGPYKIVKDARELKARTGQ